MSLGGKIWKIGWRVAVGLLLLGWIFHSIFLKEGRQLWERSGANWETLSRLEQWKIAWTSGPGELWRTVSFVQPGAFLLSILFVGLTILLGILRWRLVLQVQGLHLPFSRAAGISFVAHFFNSFLLGSTGGDLIKAYYAARETHHKKPEAVVTVFFDRLIGLWAMLLFAALMMIPNFDLIFTSDRLGVLGAIVLAMLAACSGFLTIALWGGMSNYWSGARNLLRKLPKGDVLERSLDSCRQFGRHKMFLIKALFISFSINAICVMQVLILTKGLGLTASPVIFFAIVPIIISISALPITPSGLGLRENLFVLTLAVPAINIANTPALSLSLLTFAGSLFWSLVGGIVYFCLRDKQHLEEVTQNDEST